MARGTQHYLIEEQTTGLYIVPGRAGNRLATRRDATRYTTRTAALIALANAGLGCEALDVVRVAA